MKKVLIAGAALMLAGSFVSAASAEVNLSGDARIRYIGQSDYKRVYTPNPDRTLTEDTNGYYDEIDSRIRVKFEAKAKGGAFMKARLRFDDFKFWDGQDWGAYKNENVKNVWADYAYIGIPMGPVTVEGGRMPDDFSKFFSWDNRPTRLKATYEGGGVKVIGLIDILEESTDNILDEWDDNDFMAYGLVASFQIGDNWNVRGYARYQDDSREYNAATAELFDPATGEVVDTVDVMVPHNDQSGFLGSIHADGKAGMVGLEGEFAYKSSDVLGTEDDGFGWYVQASLDMGAFVPAFQFGMTTDGYQADDDFGFIMIGAAEPITVVDQLGTEYGDSMWAAFTANYAISDQFKMAGNLVYYDIDINDEEADIDVRGLVDAFEISGSATYTVSEGANITYKLGYLSPSYDGRINSAGISDDAYFGQYLRMAIKF
jgi:hypothetical protein